MFLVTITILQTVFNVIQRDFFFFLRQLELDWMKRPHWHRSMCKPNYPFVRIVNLAIPHVVSPISIIKPPYKKRQQTERSNLVWELRGYIWLSCVCCLFLGCQENSPLLLCERREDSGVLFSLSVKGLDRPFLCNKLSGLISKIVFRHNLVIWRHLFLFCMICAQVNNVSKASST